MDRRHDKVHKKLRGASSRKVPYAPDIAGDTAIGGAAPATGTTDESALTDQTRNARLEKRNAKLRGAANRKVSGVLEIDAEMRHQLDTQKRTQRRSQHRSDLDLQTHHPDADSDGEPAISESKYASKYKGNMPPSDDFSRHHSSPPRDSDSSSAHTDMTIPNTITQLRTELNELIEQRQSIIAEIEHYRQQYARQSDIETKIRAYHKGLSKDRLRIDLLESRTVMLSNLTDPDNGIVARLNKLV
ncbi:hypothetical protein CANCADRAFT_4278 [Tortispora caseinolytica NRRL Y-17796]|uniref:Uncharacterized protein n=1 Tax=Tortispora caseinolytica NRRL Y-17796 TaxID=767744 RepID=A0A1E4TD28_9ASCO|nr:hypothetical protein CANCADRAFT_4278 [Tortispora caseinolytica NRRL Y-17796]